MFSSRDRLTNNAESQLVRTTLVAVCRKVLIRLFDWYKELQFHKARTKSFLINAVYSSRDRLTNCAGSLYVRPRPVSVCSKNLIRLFDKYQVLQFNKARATGFLISEM